jgi:hypothetical protein
MPGGMMVILAQRIMDKKMSANQLTDAINNVIDTLKYPIPTVADIVSYDKKEKLYNHKEVAESIKEGYSFDDYEMITINDKKRWIRK